MNNQKTNKLKPQEEFIRQLIFMQDDDKVLAIFPFYHYISDEEYEVVIENFYDDADATPPPKNEFCLMNESDFGWGWVHNKMITALTVSTIDEYEDFRDTLIDMKVIKKTFVLNED